MYPFNHFAQKDPEDKIESYEDDDVLEREVSNKEKIARALFYLGFLFFPLWMLNAICFLCDEDLHVSIWASKGFSLICFAMTILVFVSTLFLISHSVLVAVLDD